MATISNLYIDAGSDYSVIITVSAPDGQPLDLDGYTAASQMRKSYGSLTYYDFDASIYDAAAGKVQIALSADDSDDIPPGRWLYDVEITHTESGATKRVVEGIVTITPQITKPT